MLVYGDRWRTVAPDALLDQIAATLEAADSETGLARRDRLTAALIAAGELAQGLADAEFEAAGLDDLTPLQAASLDLACAVARRLHVAWRGEGREASAAPELAALDRLELPKAIRCKTPEGYAFYAVHPEDYFAATSAQDWTQPPLAIGLRSIGTSLAAAVAAATGGAAISLRPTGHPLRRELRVSERLRDCLAAHPGPFAIADEGPGLSGSSFGAAADLLESLGVPSDRIVFLPSHAGSPGASASPRHRRRWEAASRRVAGFDEAAAQDLMRHGFADLIGPVDRVEDLSAGGWRRDLPEACWPPAAVAWERRKYRLATPGGRYVARFAGLGGHGEAKLARARALGAAGFAPEPLALRRGFLLQRWVEGAPIDPHGVQRPAFLAHLGRYLGLRARMPASPGETGASLVDLREMAVVNCGELLGPVLATAAEARLQDFEALAGRLAPVEIDGRLQAWEWIRTGSGFCKLDALDHGDGHDLIGRQDIAWDLAGAAVEFELSEPEVEVLCARVGDLSGRPVPVAATAAFAVCYAAFQAGAWVMAGEVAAPAEQGRIAAQRDRHVAWLRRTLAA